MSYLSTGLEPDTLWTRVFLVFFEGQYQKWYWLSNNTGDNMNESLQDKQVLISQKWADLRLLQEHYAEFDWLLQDVIENLLGFTCTPLQLDIGEFVSSGPKYRMVQAQRGQAKTTITAIYAVWRLIHDPSTRVLIVSAGSDMASEIANWIIQIINGMDELECLRPDRAHGDRASVTAFDVHWALKGPEKSPSVACIGIGSNMQGKRADILIADDIESSKNSQTATMRNRLLYLTRDFTSICSTGDIIYLGTPQSIDSVYNSLPGRGFVIRVWPGRYPTKTEMLDYEGYLAPSLLEAIQANPALQTGGGPTGDRGACTDPVLLDEDALTKKEIDQGPAYFQLQHMLSTKLSDQDRYPLKLNAIRFFAFDTEQKQAPMLMQHVQTDQNLITMPEGFPIKDRVFRLQEASEFSAIDGWHMAVDPTGGGANGDEVTYAITGMCAGRVLLADHGGMRSGINDTTLDWLTAIAEKWKPFQIDIEKNYGNGALAAAWTPKLLQKHNCHIEEVWHQGQKELRIIDVLEPVIAAGKLVIHEGLIQKDWETLQQYSAEVRGTYSLFWQMARITRDRGALHHDDRVESVAMSVGHWTELLRIDDEKAKLAAQREAYQRMIDNPLGNGRKIPGFSAPDPVLGVKQFGNYSAIKRHINAQSKQRINRH